MSKTVYLSGPVTGLTYNEARFGWRRDFASLLDLEIRVLSPMRHEGHLAEMKDPIEPHNLPEGLFSQPKMIVRKDFLDIDASDVVVVNFLETARISQGTLIEIGYAAAKGKTIIVVQDKLPVHNSPFIGELAIMVRSLKEAAAITNSLLSEGI